MIKKTVRSSVRKNKHQKIRNKISGTAQKPRLSVFRSNSNMYVQVIDDVAGHTLVSASTVEKEVKEKLEKTTNIEAATLIGEIVAKRAIGKGIQQVVFDRGGYIYHGKVKALADAAREAGLEF